MTIEPCSFGCNAAAPSCCAMPTCDAGQICGQSAANACGRRVSCGFVQRHLLPRRRAVLQRGAAVLRHGVLRLDRDLLRAGHLLERRLSVS